MVTKADDTIFSSIRVWSSCLFTSKAQIKSMSLSLHVPGCKLHASTCTSQYKLALNKVRMQPHYRSKGLSYIWTRLPESKVKGTGSEQSVIPWHRGWVFFLPKKGAVESAVPFEQLSAPAGAQGKALLQHLPALPWPVPAHQAPEEGDRWSPSHRTDTQLAFPLFFSTPASHFHL